MKLWILAGVLALAVGYFDLLPFESVDAGELYIVETLLAEEADGEITLYAGTVEGHGATVQAAAKDMENTAPGQIFLRQTKRIIFCGGMTPDPMAMPETLPMGAGIYGTDQEAEELLEIKDLEDILEARERRDSHMPTLARLKNSALLGKTPTLSPLPWEEENQ